MLYHLHHQGSDLGAYPLEELRQRRQRNELTGQEFVWCEGMSDWRVLDDVLGISARVRDQANPPPLPGAVSTNKNSSRVMFAVVAVAVAAVAVVCVLAIAVVKRLERRVESGPLSATLESGLGTALPESERAVPVSKKALTERDVANRKREFRVRQWLEGYKERGHRVPSLDAETLLLVEAWIARNYGGAGVANAGDNRQRANQLLADAECDDPLIWAVAALDSTGTPQSLARLEHAVEIFPHSNYRGYPSFCAAVELSSHFKRQRDRLIPLDTLGLGSYQRTLTDGSLRPGDEEEIADVLINGWGYDFFVRNRNEVCRITDQVGQAYPWLGLVLDGEREIMEAWVSRGGGYANTVTDAGQRGFETHSAKARENLTKAWHLRPRYPLAAERLMYVALGVDGLAEMRKWFDRVIEVQIDYPRAWNEFRWGLRPRWYGDLDSMLAFGVSAVGTRRFDTDVPRKFFDVVEDLEAERGVAPGERIFGEPRIWPHLQEMYEGYIAEPTQSASRRGWQSSYAAIAYFAHRYDVARAQLEKLEWDPVPWNLTGWRTDLSLMPFEVAARTGVASNVVANAETDADAGQLVRAVEAYSKLIGGNAADDRTLTFARVRVATLELEQKFRSGGWVDYLPKTEGDLAWNTAWSQSVKCADGNLLVQSGPDGHMIFSRARVGIDFEMKGEFQFAQTPNQGSEVGLILGSPDSAPGVSTSDWYGIRIVQNAGDHENVSLTTGWRQTLAVDRVNLNPDHNEFYLRSRPGDLIVKINGHVAVRDDHKPRLAHVSADALRVGFGAPGEIGPSEIRYINVKIRKPSLGQE